MGIKKDLTASHACKIESYENRLEFIIKSCSHMLKYILKTLMDNLVIKPVVLVCSNL